MCISLALTLFPKLKIKQKNKCCPPSEVLSYARGVKGNPNNVTISILIGINLYPFEILLKFGHIVNIKWS